MFPPSSCWLQARSKRRPSNYRGNAFCSSTSMNLTADKVFPLVSSKRPTDGCKVCRIRVWQPMPVSTMKTSASPARAAIPSVAFGAGSEELFFIPCICGSDRNFLRHGYSGDESHGSRTITDGPVNAELRTTDSPASIQTLEMNTITLARNIQRLSY